jgi:hypothetical protein
MREVTKDFIQNSSISDTGNHAAIVRFNLTATRQQVLTGNQGLLISAVNNMTNSGGTYYLDALQKAQDEFASANIRATAPKILIFLSDGSPSNASGADATTADKNAIRNRTSVMKSQNIKIYTIGVGDTNTMMDPIDTQLLTDMAGNGGSYADANSQAQLESVLDQISDDVTCN